MQALKEKITPKELCDKYNALHRETYDWFEIACVINVLICGVVLTEMVHCSFDYFGRTSTPQHTEYVHSEHRILFLLISPRISQEIYINLSKNGMLEKQVKEQAYCDGCKK